MPKTERLVIKIWQLDKEALERMAAGEGEPVAVIVRRIIRRAVRESLTLDTTPAPSAAESSPREVSP